MIIAFHTNQINLLGVEVSIYDYADYCEKLLGHKAIIISSGKNRVKVNASSHTNQPLESDYQKIAHLTGNYFSGFGRGSILGTSLDIVNGLKLLMPPSQAVVDNIDYVFRELKFKYI